MALVRGLVGLLVIFLFGHVSCGTPGIKLTFDPDEGLGPGDDVTLTCTAHEKGFLDVVRIVHVIEGEITISNMGILDQKFKDTGRFDAKYDEENNVGVLSLTIKNLQYSDLGKYGCKLLHADETHDDFEELIFGSRTPPKQKVPQMTASGSGGRPVASLTTLFLLAILSIYRLLV